MSRWLPCSPTGPTRSAAAAVGKQTTQCCLNNVRGTLVASLLRLPRCAGKCVQRGLVQMRWVPDQPWLLHRGEQSGGAGNEYKTDLYHPKHTLLSRTLGSFYSRCNADRDGRFRSTLGLSYRLEEPEVFLSQVCGSSIANGGYVGRAVHQRLTMGPLALQRPCSGWTCPRTRWYDRQSVHAANIHAAVTCSPMSLFCCRLEPAQAAHHSNDSAAGPPTWSCRPERRNQRRHVQVCTNTSTARQDHRVPPLHVVTARGSLAPALCSA